MEKHKQYLIKANMYKMKSEEYLAKSVHQLMREKGFSEEIVPYFSACYAGGNETVIEFCQEGDMSDLDISVANGMTKEEIIKILSRNLSKENIELLKTN